MPKRTILLFLAALLFPASVLAGMPEGSLYMEGANSKVGVILAHGQGLKPNSKIVNPLRKTITSELGYHTLSLQMPVLPGEHIPEKFKEYEPEFPKAYETIKAGIDFLRNEKKLESIYLVGYSMGGRMATGYLAANPDSGVKGFVGVGLLGGGNGPLNANQNLKTIKIPVLDIYADTENDLKFAELRKYYLSSTYRQVHIPGAKHDFDCCEDKVVAATLEWLKGMEGAK